MFSQRHWTTLDWRWWWTCLVDSELAAWLFPTDLMVTVLSRFFFSFLFLFLMDILWLTFGTFSVYLPSATGRTLCHPAVTASRNGFLWHTREYTGIDCHCWKCSCSSRATVGELWSVVSCYYPILSDDVACWLAEIGCFGPELYSSLIYLLQISPKYVSNSCKVGVGYHPWAVLSISFSGGMVGRSFLYILNIKMRHVIIWIVCNIIN